MDRDKDQDEGEQGVVRCKVAGSGHEGGPGGGAGFRERRVSGTQGRRQEKSSNGLHYTVCPRSSDQFYIVGYFIKLGRYFLDIQYCVQFSKRHTTVSRE